jgi:hypothetical protein
MNIIKNIIHFFIAYFRKRKAIKEMRKRLEDHKIIIKRDVVLGFIYDHGLLNLILYTKRNIDSEMEANQNVVMDKAKHYHADEGLVDKVELVILTTLSESEVKHKLWKLKGFDFWGNEAILDKIKIKIETLYHKGKK